MAHIRERLDRSIANVQWGLDFPNAGVRHYSVTNLDHTPLILNIFGEEIRLAKSFKFEKFWAREESCFGIIAETWRKSRIRNHAWVLFAKISAAREALRQWN